ncbi:MAG: FumA C-terminus/TtdB family hydratase beta subunit [Caldisericia bacterium]|nr:FumA C-terminus/TtdB family hydratase beta subunit [Caldisericia bacterium]
MKTWSLQTPLQDMDLTPLHIGETVLVSGVIYTARDAAHKKIVEKILKHEELPFSLQGGVLFFVGPTPSPPGYSIGSSGPTTSGRMDEYSPLLLDHGLKAMIGKGPRNEKVIQSIVTNKAIYLIAVGGIGALLSKKILNSSVIAYPELGAEAIRKLVVREFPTIVGVDTYGRDLYKEGPASYLRELE